MIRRFVRWCLKKVRRSSWKLGRVWQQSSSSRGGEPPRVARGGGAKKTSDLRVVVYATIYGDYDDLKPVPPQTVAAEYVCLSDVPREATGGWQVVVPPFPRRDLHPRLRAKFFKMFPWRSKPSAAPM